MNYEPYDSQLFGEGIEYNVGTNDGNMFNRVIYLGKQMHNGKPMLKFVMFDDKREVIINPSYMSWAIEGGGQFPEPEDFETKTTKKEKPQNG
jgi:hypothetical protein